MTCREVLQYCYRLDGIEATWTKWSWEIVGGSLDISANDNTGGYCAINGIIRATSGHKKDGYMYVNITVAPVIEKCGEATYKDCVVSLQDLDGRVDHKGGSNQLGTYCGFHNWDQGWKTGL